MYGLVRWLRPETVVEVGAWHGFSTMHLAQACQDNGFGTVYAIDDFSLGNSGAVIHNNLQKAGLSHRLVLVPGKSTDVTWPGKVDFAFVDGDHSLQGCLHDCNKAIERGARCVCIHDTVGWWGPRDYMDLFREQAVGTWDCIEGNFDSGFAVLVRREDKPDPTYTEESHPSGSV